MASTINATSTGSGGLITTGNSVNQLELQTGDTTRVVIDSSGNVTIQGQGDLRLADSDSSHYVALQDPGTVASNVTFTLPSADGTSGQVLQTNGSGTLSFATPASGFSQAQIFTSSGSFTVPSSGKFKVTIVGGGGSGGVSNGSGSASGGGGAGGGTVIKWFSGATPGATATVTIGTGGAGVSTNSTAGNAGGNSTFVLSGFTTLTANGGSGGEFQSGNAPVSGGTATGGDINVAGGYGTTPVEQSGTGSNRPTTGGSTLFGIGGANFQANGSSLAGTGFGSGSTGTWINPSSAGKNGICIVEY